ncbi:MAG: hypothetical protein JSV89_19160 [Spirochaetaceae bacterium]|nr:MAG: hypothetical protein JSV89_19160 [Spirochaetaceae bacterium]
MTSTQIAQELDIDCEYRVSGRIYRKFNHAVHVPDEDIRFYIDLLCVVRSPELNQMYVDKVKMYERFLQSASKYQLKRWCKLQAQMRFRGRSTASTRFVSSSSTQVDMVFRQMVALIAAILISTCMRSAEGENKENPEYSWSPHGADAVGYGVLYFERQRRVLRKPRVFTVKAKNKAPSEECLK